jgi:hypothetical protein
MTHPWTFGWDALVAIGTLGLALFAFVQLRSFTRSERRRTQPVAVANGAGGEGLVRLRVFLTNHGTGTAFNVRFGVRLDSREFAVGGDRGHRYTVGPGERVPSEREHERELEVEVSATAYMGTRRGRGVYARRVYWARYEDAFGRVWETANPADPLADFDVFPSSRRRRWFVERRQRFGRWWDERVVNRWVSEEFQAAREDRELSRWQRLRRWFERRVR